MARKYSRYRKHNVNPRTEGGKGDDDLGAGQRISGYKRDQAGSEENEGNLE